MSRDPVKVRAATARYKERNRDLINARARAKWQKDRDARGDPCTGHACDDCWNCRVLAKCCRGDNPQYRLPPIGSIQPFFGLLGSIEEDAESVRCHVCGDWFRRLTQHIWHQHDLTSAEYRSIFGLAWTQPLISPIERKLMSQLLEPFQGADPERMDQIRPTPERVAMLASRPERLQVRKKKAPIRRAWATSPAVVSQRGSHQIRNSTTCKVCGEWFYVERSAIARGRVTCGRKECGREWRRRHYRPPTNAKLTPAIVKEMRRQLASGVTRDDVASRFGVTKSNVRLIDIGETWPEDRL